MLPLWGGGRLSIVYEYEHNLVVSGVETDKVVLGGPGNGLMEHRDPNTRVFRPERQVHVKKTEKSGRHEWEV
jgi:hypothetical protein